MKTDFLKAGLRLWLWVVALAAAAALLAAPLRAAAQGEEALFVVSVNPEGKYINIKAILKYDGHVRLTVADEEGKIVGRYDAPRINGENDFLIIRERLEPGKLYRYEILYKGRVYMGNFEG